ncbi:hypothetical protein O9992_21385 [Vibrio lentus]|nr:hypothetical protein [Vibrio lentus]
MIQDRDGNITPGVAESWETEDNQTFVFHLRKDARNGLMAIPDSR